MFEQNVSIFGKNDVKIMLLVFVPKWDLEINCLRSKLFIFVTLVWHTLKQFLLFLHILSGTRS